MTRQEIVNAGAASLRAMGGFNPLASARERALALARDLRSWPAIAGALTREGFSVIAIKQIGKDQRFQREIADLINAAEHARLIAVAPPAQTWRIEEPKTKARLFDPD